MLEQGEDEDAKAAQLHEEDLHRHGTKEGDPADLQMECRSHQEEPDPLDRDHDHPKHQTSSVFGAGNMGMSQRIARCHHPRGHVVQEIPTT